MSRHSTPSPSFSAGWELHCQSPSHLQGLLESGLAATPQCGDQAGSVAWYARESASLAVQSRSTARCGGCQELPRCWPAGPRRTRLETLVERCAAELDVSVVDRNEGVVLQVPRQASAAPHSSGLYGQSEVGGECAGPSVRAVRLFLSLSLALDGVGYGSLRAPVGVQGCEVGCIDGEIVGLCFDRLEVTTEGQGLLPEHCLTMTGGDCPRALAGDSCRARVHGVQIEGEADSSVALHSRPLSLQLSVDGHAASDIEFCGVGYWLEGEGVARLEGGLGPGTEQLPPSADEPEQYSPTDDPSTQPEGQVRQQPVIPTHSQLHTLPRVSDQRDDRGELGAWETHTICMGERTSPSGTWTRAADRAK
eukprot:2891360-Rhodomonas_salina.1